MAFLMCFLLTCVIIGCFMLLSVGQRGWGVSRESISSFECGFDPKSGGRLVFSIRFFVFMLLFIFFDFEVMLVLFFPVLVGGFSWFIPLVTLSIFLSFLLEEEDMMWA